jgi:PPIC-type PPIASE domain/SurA-like N-terminal domain
MAARDSQKASRKDTEQPGKDRSRRSRMSPWMYAFSVGILVVIVVTFVGGPMLSGTGSGGSISFGSYAGEEIEYVPGNYLSRQKDAIAEQVSQSGTDSNLEWVAYQVWRAGFQNTVIHTAILQSAERSGLRFAEETIDKALTGYSGYLENGVFSASRYRDTPNTEKASIRKYYREELIHNQYMNDILYGAKVPSAATDFIKGMASSERSFFYLRVGYEQFPEDLVWNYAEQNSDLFRKISLSRITVNSSEENARSIHQQVSADQALFEEVARTQSKDAYAEAGGYIGWQYYYSLSSDLEAKEDVDAVFGLSAGEVSDVIATPYGWVIYKANEPAVEADRENRDDIETVRSYMERFERGTIEDYLVAEGASIRERAAEEGLENVSAEGWESGETASFPLNYGNIEILKPVQDANEESGSFAAAAYDESVLTELFSLGQESVSQPQILEDKVYIFELKEITEADPQSLGTLDFYYAYLAQQYTESDMRAAILGSDKFEDNFDAVFSKYFLSN